MNNRLMRSAALVVLLPIPWPIVGQPVPAGTPRITTVGRAEVRREPDHATLTVGVQVLESTATAAAAAMSDALQSIVDTLVALGIPAESLPMRGFAVDPQYSFEGERRLTGYGAQANIAVPVEDLTLVGAVIDAALAGGANDIGAIEFGLRDDRAARGEALRRAVDQARFDAEALAAAMGGRLGALVDLHTGGPMTAGFGVPEGVVFRASRAATVPVTPREVVVEAMVTVQWQFVP